jgi:hypothetical protein
MNEGFFSSPRREEGANRDSQPTSNAGIGKKTRSLHKFSREAAESSWFSKKSEYVICKAGYSRTGVRNAGYPDGLDVRRGISAFPDPALERIHGGLGFRLLFA